MRCGSDFHLVWFPPSRPWEVLRIEDSGPLRNMDGLDGYGRARSFYETFI